MKSERRINETVLEITPKSIFVKFVDTRMLTASIKQTPDGKFFWQTKNNGSGRYNAKNTAAEAVEHYINWKYKGASYYA